MFVAVDLAAPVGLLVYARRFASDAAAVRQRARRVMNGIYGAVFVTGAFFVWVALSAPAVQFRTAVQALIFLLIGGVGMTMNRSARTGGLGAA